MISAGTACSLTGNDLYAMSNLNLQVDIPRSSVEVLSSPLLPADRRREWGAINQAARAGITRDTHDPLVDHYPGEGRPPNALQIVKGSYVVDLQALILAKADLGGDVAHGSRDGRDH
jgi:hypothetical protein